MAQAMIAHDHAADVDNLGAASDEDSKSTLDHSAIEEAAAAVRHALITRASIPSREHSYLQYDGWGAVTSAPVSDESDEDPWAVDACVAGPVKQLTLGTKHREWAAASAKPVWYV